MISPAMLSFLETYCKCSAQFKFSTRIIPKYLVEVFGNNFLPSMSRTKSCCWGLLLFEYYMQCVLSKFKESLLLATHDFRFFDSFSVFALSVCFDFSLHISTASSAYKAIFESVQAGKSFIYTRNKNGPRILPCGTPQVIVIIDEQ